jgi:hypothetical protein
VSSGFPNVDAVFARQKSLPPADAIADQGIRVAERSSRSQLKRIGLGAPTRTRHVVDPFALSESPPLCPECAKTRNNET